MLLEIDIPEEMLESEVLDAIVYVDTDHKVIKKVHIEPRVDDTKNILDWIKAEINTPNRGTCDYFIVDRIEKIINEYGKGKEV